MFLSAISGAVGAVSSVGILMGSGGTDGLSTYKGDCPGQPTWPQIDAAIARAPLSEKDELARLIRRAAQGAGPSNGAGLVNDKLRWVQAAMGGKDCVASSSRGQTLKNYFLRFVQQWGMVGTATPNQQGFASNAPSIPATPIVIGASGEVTVPVQPEQAERGFWNRLGGALIEPFKESGKAAAVAALGTAESAGAQARQTRQGITTASFLGLPVLGIAVLVLALGIFTFARSR